MEFFVANCVEFDEVNVSFDGDAAVEFVVANCVEFNEVNATFDAIILSEPCF